MSSGVLLKPCVNQLITLPMSQHHIKISIFRDGFTFVVWIESATTDELSAKMIRARLSESLLTIEEEGSVCFALLEEFYCLLNSLKKANTDLMFNVKKSVT